MPYYFKVQARDAAGLLAESGEIQATPATLPGAPIGVTAVAGNGGATVSFNAPSDDGGSPITGYEVTAMPGNVTAIGSGSPIAVTGLTNGTTYTFTVKAINGVDKSVASALSNAVTPTVPPPSGSRRTTRIVVDEDKLRQRLDKEGERAVIAIPVHLDSEVVIGELNGRMVKNMEERQAVVEIRTEQASYALPALQIHMDELAKRFGTNPTLQDIKIRIEIAAPSAETIRRAENSASGRGLSIVVPPLSFSVTAVYGGQVEEVSQFNAYVQRTVAIPAGIDPDRITTGVVIAPDGSVRHVPTKIIVKDGMYFAQINSLTNSLYSVVWNPLEFKDTASHWAKEAINDMGSRMVVNGTGNGSFSPNRDITRAEFAAIIVRRLGLREASGETAYSDVRRADWFSGAIRTAHSYGLVDGFADGTFRPGERLTREQAMTIVSKAMAGTGLSDGKSGQSADSVLRMFNDAGDISGWALKGAADSVSTGMIAGRSGGLLAPKAWITRAEAAAMMQRLLQKSDWINE